MMRRLSTLPLLLALLTIYVALTPLAYADPPDPLWIAGFYDDDDNDDSVFVITSHLATVEPPPLPSWIPLPRSEPFAVADHADPAEDPYLTAAAARAPPLS